MSSTSPPSLSEVRSIAQTSLLGLSILSSFYELINICRFRKNLTLELKAIKKLSETTLCVGLQLINMGIGKLTIDKNSTFKVSILFILGGVFTSGSLYKMKTSSAKESNPLNDELLQDT